MHSFQETAFGRFVTSNGNVEFVTESTPTPGAENSYPAIGPIVINEVMYHPASGGDEFIELYNTSSSAVSLYHSAYAGDAWSIGGGISYTFTATTTLASHAYLIILPNDVTDTAAFAAKYGVPQGVQIISGYSGHLSNSSDSVRLCQPEEPDPTNNYQVPQVLTDRVEYEDVSPWPVAADGGGPSLERLSQSQYGNDPANWYAGPNEGTPGQVNGSLDVTLPRIVSAATRDGIPTNVVVTFNEDVDPTTALNPANYLLSNNMTVINVIAGADAKTVVLITTALMEGPVYTLTVSNVRNTQLKAIPTDPACCQATFNFVDIGKGLQGEYFQYGSDFANRYDASHLRSRASTPRSIFNGTTVRGPCRGGRRLRRALDGARQGRLHRDLHLLHRDGRRREPLGQ